MCVCLWLYFLCFDLWNACVWHCKLCLCVWVIVNKRSSPLLPHSWKELEITRLYSKKYTQLNRSCVCVSLSAYFQGHLSFVSTAILSLCIVYFLHVLLRQRTAAFWTKLLFYGLNASILRASELEWDRDRKEYFESVDLGVFLFLPVLVLVWVLRVSLKRYEWSCGSVLEANLIFVTAELFLFCFVAIKIMSSRFTAHFIFVIFSTFF